MCGQEKVHQDARTTEESRSAVFRACSQPFEQQLHAVGDQDRHHGMGRSLLEAEHRVAKDVERGDGHGESA
jgi:hypothetical protein